MASKLNSAKNLIFIVIPLYAENQVHKQKEFRDIFACGKDPGRTLSIVRFLTCPGNMQHSLY